MIPFLEFLRIHHKQIKACSVNAIGIKKVIYSSIREELSLKIVRNTLHKYKYTTYILR